LRNGLLLLAGILALSLIAAAPASAAIEDLGPGYPGPRQPVGADGRYVVFASGAADLVPGGTNEAFDIFVRDRVTGTVERGSVSSGVQANGPSRDPAISADGR
jgi:hypothetical protein